MPPARNEIPAARVEERKKPGRSKEKRDRDDGRGRKKEKRGTGKG